MVTVAFKNTVVPEQMVVCDAVIFMVGAKDAFTVTVMLLLSAIWLKEVITLQFMISPLLNSVLL